MEVSKIDLESLPAGSKSHFKLHMVKNALGESWQIPIMIAKGTRKGPTLGITAALHGNELNGIPIIHHLWDKIDPTELTGTVFAVPVLNAPGFLRGEREFEDGRDLNRIMPGRPNGTTSEIYAHQIVTHILKKFDLLIDLHTASFGRINSLYVRADLSNSTIEKMALLQEPQLIVNKAGKDGTLRGEASKLGIPAITVEVGDPQIFQKRHIRDSIFGLNNVLAEFGMIKEKPVPIESHATVCKTSYWVYAKNGGLLTVLPSLTETLTKGEKIAQIRDIYGNVQDEIFAPEDGILVAKSTNPVCQEGSRVAHIGVHWEDYYK